MHPTPGLCRRLCQGVLVSMVLATAAFADDYAPVNELIRAGQWQQAMARVQRHLADKPRDVQMRFLKGLIEQDSGKPLDAIATYNQLIDDHPELPEPYNNVAVLYAAQGQYDKARAALELAIRANSGYAIAHENLGDVYARMAYQSYLLSQRHDGGNPTLAPKLALLRQMIGTPVPPRSPAPPTDKARPPTPAASASR